MLEKDVEAAHVKKIAKTGGASYKFKSPARNNVPDRIDLLGLAPAARMLQTEMLAWGFRFNEEFCLALARGIVASAIQFTELKAPGKKPNTKQLREHARLRDLGFVVNVVDSKD